MTSAVWLSSHGWCWTSLTVSVRGRRHVEAVADLEVVGPAADPVAEQERPAGDEHDDGDAEQESRWRDGDAPHQRGGIPQESGLPGVLPIPYGLATIRNTTNASRTSWSRVTRKILSRPARAATEVGPSVANSLPTFSPFGPR